MLAGCVPQQSPVVAVAMPLPGVLVAETLFISVVRLDEVRVDSAVLADVSETLSASFPHATVRSLPPFDEYSATPGQLRARIVVQESVSFSGGRWSSSAILSLLVIDWRFESPSIAEVVAFASASRFNTWGYQSRDDAQRAALSAAVTKLVGDIALVARREHGQSVPLVLSSAPADYIGFGAQGTGSVAGQAFLTTRGGDVKLGAGRAVTLDPLTPFARAWYQRAGSRINGFDVSPPDSLFVINRREVVSDAEGRFQFKNVPTGQYLLRSSVTWEIPGQPLQGGVVATLVSIGANDSVAVVLSRTNFVLP